MNTMSTTPDSGFYRDADRAMLGGVCAGIARYLGFNLCVTRFLAVIALLMTGPLMVVGYIAAVLLIPSASGREFPYRKGPRYRRGDRTSRHGRRAARRKTCSDAAEPTTTARTQLVREKCDELNERLQALEKAVTSRKFQIDQELRRL